MGSLRPKMYPLLMLPFMALVTMAAKPAYCPLLGPVFPAPSYLSSDPTFAAAKANISMALDQAAHAGNLTDSVSLQIFSGSDPNPLFRYSYTAPITRNATIGVREVNENTVFRIGSGSKLWTMFLFLMRTHGALFNEPIAKYVPELLAAAKDVRHNSTRQRNKANYLQWNQVTIGELASHLAGLTRDCMPPTTV